MGQLTSAIVYFFMTCLKHGCSGGDVQQTLGSITWVEETGNLDPESRIGIEPHKITLGYRLDANLQSNCWCEANGPQVGDGGGREGSAHPVRKSAPASGGV